MLAALRFVLRALVRNRGFTLVTVLTLALGIGSSASIFSVVDWVLFRANQFPDDVFLIGGQGDDRPFTPVRYEFMTRPMRRKPGRSGPLPRPPTVRATW